MWKMVVKLGWMHVITTCSVPVHSCLLCLYSTSYVERWTDAGGTGCRTCCPVMELAAVHMPPHDDLSSPQHLGIMPTLLSTWTHADNIIGSFRKPGKVWEWEWGWDVGKFTKRRGKVVEMSGCSCHRKWRILNRQTLKSYHIYHSWWIKL